MLRLNESLERKTDIEKLKSDWKKSTVEVSCTSNVVGRVSVFLNGVEYILTKKIKTFCEEYVKNCGNVSLSCKNAGISKATANVVLYDKKKHMQARLYINELKKVQEKAIKKEFGYTAIESFKKLSNAQKMSLKMKKHVVTKNGIITLKDNPDLAAYIKSEELKGKLYGLYKSEEDTKPTTIMNIVVSGKETIGMKKLGQATIEAEVVKDE